MNVTQSARRRVLPTSLIALTAAAALVACGGSAETGSSAGLSRSATSPAVSTASSEAPARSAEALSLASASTDNPLNPPGAVEKSSTSSGSGSIVQPKNTEGRLLASNCFQCHGTMGTGGFDSIRGSEAKEVLEFMTKTANRDIMAAHAQGYTTAQLQKIIAYLQQ